MLKLELWELLVLCWKWMMVMVILMGIIGDGLHENMQIWNEIE